MARNVSQEPAAPAKAAHVSEELQTAIADGQTVVEAWDLRHLCQTYTAVSVVVGASHTCSPLEGTTCDVHYLSMRWFACALSIFPNHDITAAPGRPT